MMSELISVEYLVIVDPAKGLATNAESLEHLLRAHSDLQLSGSAVESGGATFEYEITTGRIEGTENLVFHQLDLLSSKTDLPQFRQALRAVRTVLAKASDKQVQTLSDGLGSHFAQQAYPLIHQIENLMRKLITKFMITRVGLGWTKENVPSEVVDSIRKPGQKGARRQHNFLWDTDFIQLAKFLFQPYREKGLEDLQQHLEAHGSSRIQFSELQPYVARSNWQRYFDAVVDCEGEFLQKRWGQLYDLRCKIAHNSIVTFDELERIKALVGELQPQLQIAVERLDQVEVRSEDREMLAEDAASIHEASGRFIAAWKGLEGTILALSKRIAPKNERLVKRAERRNIGGCIREFVDQKYLEADACSMLLELRDVRNTLVHFHEVEVSGSRVEAEIAKIATLRAILQGLLDEEAANDES